MTHQDWLPLCVRCQHKASEHSTKKPAYACLNTTCGCVGFKFEDWEPLIKAKEELAKGTAHSKTVLYASVKAAYTKHPIFQKVSKEEPMNLNPKFVTPVVKASRLEKFKVSVEMPQGAITIQQSPSRTGKTIRAEAWMAADPENRRIVDGDREEAFRLTMEGYDVMLNLLPEIDSEDLKANNE